MILPPNYAIVVNRMSRDFDHIAQYTAFQALIEMVKELGECLPPNAEDLDPSNREVADKLAEAFVQLGVLANRLDLPLIEQLVAKKLVLYTIQMDNLS